MNKEEIKREISKLNISIDENNKSMATLENRIYELEHIQKKLKETEDKFYDYCSRNRKRFDEMGTYLCNTRFARQCADEMMDFLSGSQSKRAVESIKSSLQVTKNEINNKEDKIESLRRNNVTLRCKVSDLEQLLRKVEMEELSKNEW